MSQFQICLENGITDELSIHLDDMMAVIVGLQWVEEVGPDSVVLCIDSAGVLLS